MDRYIIIDDTDSDITYGSGTWSPLPTQALDELYMYSGATMFGTLHSLDSATGSFSYNFTGKRYIAFFVFSGH